MKQLTIFLALMTFLAVGQTVLAQCGGESSSCQTCHEVDGEYPVNAIGEWHTDHVVGDLCASCHEGDKTTKDADAAHLAMTAPLENGTCQVCHKNEADEFQATYISTWESWNDVSETSTTFQRRSSDPGD